MDGFSIFIFLAVVKCVIIAIINEIEDAIIAASILSVSSKITPCKCIFLIWLAFMF